MFWQTIAHRYEHTRFHAERTIPDYVSIFGHKSSKPWATCREGEPGLGCCGPWSVYFSVDCTLKEILLHTILIVSAVNE